MKIALVLDHSTREYKQKQLHLFCIVLSLWNPSISLLFTFIKAENGGIIIASAGGALPVTVTFPRIGLLCLREHPRAAGWGCGWS